MRPTLEQRQEVFALKRAGCVRTAIADKTGIAMSELVKMIGPDKSVEKTRDQTTGNWRRLGSSNERAGFGSYSDSR